LTYGFFEGTVLDKITRLGGWTSSVTMDLDMVLGGPEIGDARGGIEDLYTLQGSTPRRMKGHLTPLKVDLGGQCLNARPAKRVFQHTIAHLEPYGESSLVPVKRELI
jgi:hypothetical protein